VDRVVAEKKSGPGFPRLARKPTDFGGGEEIGRGGGGGVCTRVKKGREKKKSLWKGDEGKSSLYSWKKRAVM